MRLCYLRSQGSLGHRNLLLATISVLRNSKFTGHFSFLYLNLTYIFLETIRMVSEVGHSYNIITGLASLVGAGGLMYVA